MINKEYPLELVTSRNAAENVLKRETGYILSYYLGLQKTHGEIDLLIESMEDGFSDDLRDDIEAHDLFSLPMSNSDAMALADEVSYDSDSVYGIKIDKEDLRSEILDAIMKNFDKVLASAESELSEEGVDKVSSEDNVSLDAFKRILIDNMEALGFVVTPLEHLQLTDNLREVLANDLTAFLDASERNYYAPSRSCVGEMQLDGRLGQRIADTELLTEYFLNQDLADRYPSMKGYSLDEVKSLLFVAKNMDIESDQVMGDTVSNLIQMVRESGLEPSQ